LKVMSMSREFRLGLFVVITLGILVTGVFLIGSKQVLFHSTYRVNAAFHNVSGLTLGADVRVGGIQKGAVRRIDLPKRPDGDVTVVMDLRSETRDVVKRDSLAAIKSEGMVGDKYVEISFGSPEGQGLKDGDTLKSEPPVDISDLFNKANQILDTTQSAIKNVQETAANMTSITSKIDKGQGSAGALINDKTMYKEANASVTALHENMEALKHNFLIRGFFKKRGYEDSSDITRHAIAKLPPGPYAKTFTYDAKQIFSRADTAQLKNQKLLNEAGKFLEEQKSGLVVVAASMGLKGDTEKDRVLTEARSEVVRGYLVGNFRFDDTLVKTIGLGKTGDAGDDGKVQIIVYPAGKNQAQNQSPSRPE
jgi:phospholipid/cholesterol/gamma-HCH transport system substrate-binding protein